MTMSNAIKEMRLDPTKRITHRFFSDEEFITARNGDVFDENGDKIIDFWDRRKDVQWQKGWYIHPTSPR